MAVVLRLVLLTLTALALPIARAKDIHAVDTNLTPLPANDNDDEEVGRSLERVEAKITDQTEITSFKYVVRDPASGIEFSDMKGSFQDSDSQESLDFVLDVMIYHLPDICRDVDIYVRAYPGSCDEEDLSFKNGTKLEPGIVEQCYIFPNSTEDTYQNSGEYGPYGTGVGVVTTGEWICNKEGRMEPNPKFDTGYFERLILPADNKLHSFKLPSLTFDANAPRTGVFLVLFIKCGRYAFSSANITGDIHPIILPKKYISTSTYGSGKQETSKGKVLLLLSSALLVVALLAVATNLYKRGRGNFTYNMVVDGEEYDPHPPPTDPDLDYQQFEMTDLGS